MTKYPNTQISTRRDEAQRRRKEVRSSKSEETWRRSERPLLRHSLIRTFVILWVFGCFLISHSVAAANPPLGGQAKRSNAGPALFLKELNLTEEQKPKFLAIQKAMTSKWAEFRKMPAEERKSKQAAFYKARQEELKKLLTPEQMEKYREIRARRSWGNRQSNKPANNSRGLLPMGCFDLFEGTLLDGLECAFMRSIVPYLFRKSSKTQKLL